MNDKLETYLRSQRLYFRNGNTSSIEFRIEVLKELYNAISSRKDTVVKALEADFHKPEFETLATEFYITLGELKHTIKHLKSWSTSIKVRPSVLNFPSSARIYKEPFGQVLIIAPWNYPFYLSMVPLIGAIAAGNTVILKPSEYAPNSAAILEEILNEVFTVDHARVINGDADVAKALLDLSWSYIFFTGSPATGKLVYQAAARNLTPVTLELGGKNPCVIHHTANIKLSAKRIVWGKFINAGQTCVAPDFLVLHRDIKASFIDAVKEEITRVYGTDIKNSPDLARIINQKHFKRLQRYIEESQVLFGGEYDEQELYISPTLLEYPPLQSTVMQEEIFGPLLPVLTYNDETSLGNILRNYENPLAFYVFSRDQEFSKKLIQKYSFGGGAINDVIIHLANKRLPFGGVGKSGLGAYHGKHTFDTFTHKKPVVTRGNWLDIPLRYAPYKNGTKWLERLKNYF
ncbi:aldehyde dehydrogenase [Robertkochia solimangrovi]|nr:aldehyde dehydrogenase [Robertkochia solimangrovi]